MKNGGTNKIFSIMLYFIFSQSQKKQKNQKNLFLKLLNPVQNQKKLIKIRNL